VANKFQTGFSEPLLHTMFLDKPVRDKTAVQTLSRLNRIHKEKVDTLVVDFTDSYVSIMKAYQKYQKDVTTDKSSDPKDLFDLKEALLKFNVFTAEQVTEVANLGKTGDSKNMPAIAGLIHQIKNTFEKNLKQREKRDKFRTLMGRYLSTFNYIQALYYIPNQELYDFQIFLIYLRNKLTNSDFNSLKKELEEVNVVNYHIPKVDPIPVAVPVSKGRKKGGSVVSVKKTKTVKQVIEEINEKFREIVGEDGAKVIGEFIENVTQDEELISIVRNNKEIDPNIVYEQIMRDRLKDRLVEIVMKTSPEKYEDIVSKDVLPFVNKTAYGLLREAAF